MSSWRLPHSVRVFVCLTAAIVALASDFGWSQGRQRPGRPTTVLDGHEVAEGEVIVGYRAAGSGQIQQERAAFEVDADEVEAVGRRGARRMRSRRLSTRAMLERLRNNPDIAYAEPNYVMRLETSPNEPWLSSLWGLFNNGSNGGTSGADIDATLAWDITTGTRSVVVGVIDTGIDYTHPDLAANVWRAPRDFTVTIAGVSILCRAGSRGFNAITNSCSVSDPMDDHSHGTHVAGTIGGVGNNGTGVVGVNWVASMMGLKFLASNGSGYTTDAIEAIEFAIQAKAALGSEANVRVLSNSWGGGGFSTALRNQIEAANTADMLFVAAAGNSSLNIDSNPTYPASYTNANIVSVAATTNTDARASFSNYGATRVHLGAPGQSILSTVLNGGYAYYNGTSMAAPHVSGVAALVLAQCAMTTAELKQALLESVDPISAMSGITTTGGRLNANNAVRMCSRAVLTLNGGNAPVSMAAGGSVTVNVANGPANAGDYVTLVPQGAAATYWSGIFQYLNGSTSRPSSGVATASLTFTAPATPGVYEFRFFENESWRKLATSPSLTVENPAPVLSSVSPSSIASGSTSISVTLAGTSFVPGSQARVNGAARSTTYVSATSLIVGITAADRALPGTLAITVVNPTPGGGTSSSQSLTVVPPTITVPASVNGGSSFSVSVANGPGNATDWIALFPSSGTDTSYVHWMYLNGSRTAPSTGLTQATVQFTAPTAAGTYNVRLFANNGSTKIATSANITVSGSSPPPSGPTITAPSTATSGTTLSVSIANGPGNATDWIGLFPSGGGDTSYITWMYLNGARTPPASGMTSATVSFPAPAAGTYNVRLFANNGSTKIATSNTITVSSSSAQSPSITVPSSVAGGATFTATIANGPGNAKDWVGFFPSGGGDTTYIYWMYLNGTRTAPATGTSSASVQFAAPSTPGTYNVRLFADNGTTKVATSNTLTVPAPVAQPPTITVPGSVNGGNSFSVSVANGPGNATDWIALFPSSGNDTSYVHWMYLNGSRTAPATGMTQATVQFTAPAAGGTYNVRLFANNGSTKIATSADITVNASSSPPSGPTVTAPSTATSGTTLSVSIANGPGNTTDWIGLFPSGGGDTSYITWMYLNGARTPPSSGMTSATVSFPAPAAGTYNVRLFANNGSTKIATSNTITVSSASSQ
ncbi:MAG TPA: S8 family serine peptidase [Vicinamibacterales bacterium]|nr:S8 family serine peptidase [Vicinamibacterales bacterium]